MYLDIKPVCKTVNNPQANATVGRAQQVIYNILVTKDVDKKYLNFTNNEVKLYHL